MKQLLLRERNICSYFKGAYKHLQIAACLNRCDVPHFLTEQVKAQTKMVWSVFWGGKHCCFLSQVSWQPAIHLQWGRKCNKGSETFVTFSLWVSKAKVLPSTFWDDREHKWTPEIRMLSISVPLCVCVCLLPLKDTLTLIRVGCRQDHAVHLPHLLHFVGDLINESSNFFNLSQVTTRVTTKLPVSLPVSSHTPWKPQWYPPSWRSSPWSHLCPPWLQHPRLLVSGSVWTGNEGRVIYQSRVYK